MSVCSILFTFVYCMSSNFHEGMGNKTSALSPGSGIAQLVRPLSRYQSGLIQEATNNCINLSVSLFPSSLFLSKTQYIKKNALISIKILSK